MLSEALSSVARTLNFRLTVRDNSPYSSTAPIKVGQTAFRDMAVTTTTASGPFLVSAPNTAVSWVVGTNQTVTWAVAGTTGNGVNCSFVDVFLSTDGGLTYPIQLANKVPNDGSETVTVPNNVGSTNRIMVKGNNQIFFDISNANFSITTAPTSFAITQSSVQSILACSLTTTSYTFNYSALSGFSGSTAFSVSGTPPGSTVSFSPATMSSTNGTVTMTLNNLATATPGNYNMVVTGTSGATTSAVPFYLYLGLPNVILSTPLNAATAQNTSLALSWSVNPSATSYDVQVSINSSFTPILSSGNVTSNSYNLSGLTSGTTYYWRVAPKNPTCTGTFGSPFSFTTGIVTCATSNSANVPVTIPTTVATVTSTLNIPSGVSISDVNVTVNITHTWINDLSLTLTSPTGTVVTLVANPCSPSVSVNDIAATFDDAGTAFVCSNSPGISGTVLPAQALSAFNGQSSTGTWTLTVADAFSADGGSLNSWSLNICAVAPLSVSENGLQNFAIYPNPNNGNFNVQFNSSTNNDILIGVYDMRGRQIVDKSIENTGLINQNLQLDNVQSGVYLVSVQDGNRKEVKKIIIQ